MNIGLAKTILRIVLQAAEALLGLFGAQTPAEKEVREAIQAAIDLGQAALGNSITAEKVRKAMKEFAEAGDAILAQME